jgi:hypothetical protein
MRPDGPPDVSGAEMRRHYVLVLVCEAVVIAVLWAFARIFS